MYIPPLFVQSSVDGHRSGFNHLAVVNNASRNRDVWISLGDSASFNSFFFFWCGPFLNFVSVFCFSLEACGILASQSRVELTPCALEGEMLTTGLPGKSLFSILSVVYRGGIYRSCSNSILSFLRNLHAIFHSGRTFYIPASKNKTENSCSGTCGKIGTFICTKAPIFPHVPQQLFSTLFFDSS